MSLSSSPSKRTRTEMENSVAVQLIGPSFLRMQQIGFAWLPMSIPYDFIDPEVKTSVSEGVKAALNRKRNNTAKGPLAKVLTWQLRPGTEDQQKYGIMAGVSSVLVVWTGNVQLNYSCTISGWF